VKQTGLTPKTFVLVHGAWHGGWCWGEVATLLRGRGHRVLTPTQTGLAERSHLISTTITLDTFIEDVANVLKWEDLRDVILVGHSFGASTISGVADRMKERIARLIYLDGLMLESGQTPFSVPAREIVEARIKAAQESSGGVSVPAPPASAFGVLDARQAAWLEARLTAQPLSVFMSPLVLDHPVGNGLPVRYIVCTAPVYGPLEASRRWVRAQGWHITEIETGHDAMVSAPQRLADLLDEPALS
jgi:pimeloyl-ACP methyl ester carboxylesterase